MTLLTDLRHSIRQLVRTKAFTLPAVAGLALAIGASTSVFSILHTMLLRSLGISDVSRVVAIWQSDPKRGQELIEVCLADLEDWRRQRDVIEEAALASSVNLDVPLLDGTEPQQVDMTTVTGGFFRLLGAKPAIGRLIADEDDRTGAPQVMVLSHRLWRSRYGSDPGVIGRKIRSGGDSAVVIGVTSADFDFPRDVDVFVPLHAAWPDVDKQRTFRVFRSVAKLRPGISVGEAQSRLSVIAAQADKDRPAGSGVPGILVRPLLDEIYGPARKAVWMLLGAVLLVLLIACANVANLLLARSTVRARELALRAVLGAGRTRIAGLLLMESVLIATASAVIGLTLASAGVDLLARLAPPEIPRLDEVTLSPPVLAFGIGISFLTVLLFGLGPALAASKRDFGDALRQGGNRSASAGRGHMSARRWLVGAEVALSVVLLVGAGLLIRSFAALSSVDPGFRAEKVLTFRLTTNTGSQEKRRNLYGAVLERIRSLPGVESAGAVLLRPLSGIVGWDAVYALEGQTPTEIASNPNGNYEAISPDYFRTMGIRLIAGRDFSNADTDKAPGVVIINQSTARRHWPGENAVGKRLRLSKDTKAPWLTVAAVVNDVRYREWEAARPDFYIPFTQRAQHRSDFVIRTSGDPGVLAEAVRKAVFAIDPAQPISQLTTMERLVDRAIARSRFTGLVLTALSACALLLAAIGIYGVLAWTVAQRTSEIGLRMAIGATPGSILKLIGGGGLRVTAAGGAVGLLGAAALASFVKSLLYGVEVFDPVAWSGAGFILIAVVAVACIGPAWRASRVDPARALSSD